MKFFTNQSIWKKIVIVLLIVLLFNVLLIKPVHAGSDSDNDVLEGGGKLLKPIFSLLVTVGDGIVNVLHSSIMGVDESLIVVNNENEAWSILKTIIAIVVTAACIIGAILLSGGIGAILGAVAVLSIGSSVLFGSNFIVKLEDEISHAIVTQFNEEALPSKIYFPAYSYSPEEIFRGNILLFNVNFFRDPITIKEATKKDSETGNDITSYYYYEDSEGEDLDTNGDGEDDTKGYVTSKQDSAAFLQETISNWYKAIRNICLVLMLSVLVYIGIRMLLSSVASDKAKYQTMLKDWFIGLCLLFLMHYIMAFSVTIVEKLTEVVSSSLDNNKYMAFVPRTDEIEEDLNEIGIAEDLKYSEDGKEGYMWPSNLMGYLRLKSQINTNGWQYVGEAIMFLMLTVFTVMFTITYLRRLLYMTFLTIIAPMVALTYCIDKLNDGQAQGFNKWLKEYIFNLLLQPMHLLLYYILITSSFEMMGKNVIYSIVAIGFMIPAEKLLRSLFGFEKASTPQATSPAAAMMASSALTSLLHKRKGADTGEGGSKKDKSDSDRVPKIKDSNPVDAFLDENSNSNSNGENDNQLDPEGQAWQDYIDGQEEDNGSGNPQYQTNNPHQSEDGELDAEGQAWQNYIDDQEEDNDGLSPEGQAWQDYIDSQEEDNDGLSQEGQGWQDYIDNQEENDGLDSGEQSGLDNQNNNPSNNESNSEGSTEQNNIKTKDGNSPEKGKKKKRITRAIGRRAHALRMVGRTARRKTLQGMKKLPGKGIRMAGRGVAGAAVGAMAAGAAVAIGAATGDMNNVVKMGTGAAVSGFALGSGAVKGTHVKQEYKDTYNEAMNATEYEDDAMERYVKDYKKDADNRSYFENAFGVREAKKMFKSGGEIDKYLENGITDKNEMKAMHKLQTEGVVKNIDEAIAVSQLGDMMGGSPYKMNAKNRKDWSDRIGNMAEKAGVKKDDKEKFASDRFNQIEKLFDFKR